MRGASQETLYQRERRLRQKAQAAHAALTARVAELEGALRLIANGADDNTHAKHCLEWRRIAARALGKDGSDA